jgi:polyisoprenoid-binding protein YceI
MRRLSVLIGVVSLLLCGAAAGAETGRWSVIPERSSITMRVRALGVVQTGRFDRWTGDIRFDPEEPRTARVTIDVRTASLTMRQAAVTRNAVGPGFLDAANYPSIRFQLRTLEPVSPGRFTASADVTVKDRTRPVTFPVALEITDGIARMSGGFVLDRAAYGIGTEGAMNGLIGRDVRIEVAMATRRVAS